MIEEPVEIIDNERELKGFHNMDDVIKLVGYFKSEKSPRRLEIKAAHQVHDLRRNCFYRCDLSPQHLVFSTQTSLSMSMLRRSSTLSSSSSSPLTLRFHLFLCFSCVTGTVINALLIDLYSFPDCQEAEDEAE